MVNKKFNYLKFIAIIGVGGLTIPILSSCSLFTTNIPSTASSLYKYMNSSSQLEWISQRTMSLRFIAKNGSTGYGTAWIFGKNSRKVSSYYLATNLHVAAFLQNEGKTSYVPNDYGGYSRVTNNSYNSIEFGLVGQKTLDNKFIQGTSESLKTYKDGGIHYVSYVPRVHANIIYSANDFFPKNKYKDPFEVRGQYINNPTIDLAIIEVNFEFAKSLNGYSDSILRNFLNNYDLNPTRFAKSPGENYKNLYIGGFPYDNDILNPKDPFISTPKYPIWVGLSNVDLAKVTSGLTLPIEKPNTPGLIPPYSNVALRNEISFSTNDYASYRNVALQGLMSGIDIGGGSSGSMVVNGDNDVVGIYWGTYTISISGTSTVVGGFDYFYSDKNYNVKVNGTSTLCYSYNILEDIQLKIGKSNFKTPILS